MENYPIFNNYSEKSLTPEGVRRSVVDVRKKVEANLERHADFAPFSDILYLNSSDPVKKLHESLSSMKMEGVMTVAGSGEFAQAFINREPLSLEIVDISPPALFYNELKHVALCQLPQTHYMDLLYGSGRLFNPQRYPMVRRLLSRQARSYFDTLVRPENSLLMQPGVLGRIRPSSDGKSRIVPPGVYGDELSYRRVQKRARKVAVSMIYADVTELPALGEFYSTAYLSNIPELTINYDLPKNFLARRTRRVLFSMPGSSKEQGRTEIVTDQGTIALKPGESFDIEGMRSRLLAFDPKPEFGALIEARREENTHLKP